MDTPSKDSLSVIVVMWLIWECLMVYTVKVVMQRLQNRIGNMSKLKTIWKVVWSENSIDGKCWFILLCFFVPMMIYFGVTQLGR